MVLAMLGADAAPHGRLTRGHRSLTLKGAVGRALAERGMRVGLEVLYTDDSCYEVCTAIVVTNQARPGRGRVQVADDNTIRWECRVSDPSGERPGISPEEIADAIARALAT